MNFPRTLMLSAALALGLAACQSLPERAGPEAGQATAAAVEPAANDNLNATAWLQTAVEYRLIAAQTYRAALAQLDRALQTPDWDALTRDDRDTPATGLPPAVIVDIDETVLDNSPYQARLVRDGRDYDDPSWDAWVHERKAKPVPGALEFAQAAAARGVTVFYLSNRAVHLEESTLANLRAVGFPIDSREQFLGLGYLVEGCEQHGSDKGCRRRHVGRTHRVLMQFGDQIGDLVSLTAKTREGREQAVAPYLDWVGERWWLLPNPSYGSWEPALFNNDWSLPPAERRRLKLQALDYAE